MMRPRVRRRPCRWFPYRTIGPATLEATAFPHAFGLAHIGAIRGVVHTLGVAGSAFGPVMLSLGHTWLGSYRPALLVLATLPLATTVFAALAKAPPPYPHAPSSPRPNRILAPLTPPVPKRPKPHARPPVSLPSRVEQTPVSGSPSWTYRAAPWSPACAAALVRTDVFVPGGHQEEEHSM
jgi:hypothetical protein